MGKTYSPKPDRYPITRSGYDTLVAEKNKRMSERPDAVEQLRLAREMGDLSENGYYKAARARLSFLDAQIRRLDRQIRHSIITVKNTNGIVGVGSTITVESDEKTMTFSVVGSAESDPDKSAISSISPLGRQLMGRKSGDTVTIHAPAGIKNYTIKDVS